MIKSEIIEASVINELAKQNRIKEYREVTDPMYFKARRGEVSMVLWSEAVAKIKEKYPYVTEDQVITVEYPDES